MIITLGPSHIVYPIENNPAVLKKLFSKKKYTKIFLKKKFTSYFYSVCVFF